MQRSERLPEYGHGACSVLVEDHDYTRARKILTEDDGGFDEEELAQLSEQAAQRARAAAKRPGQVAASTPQAKEPRHWLRRLFASRRTRTPENPFSR
jgi:hypothetical protein